MSGRTMQPSGAGARHPLWTPLTGVSLGSSPHIVLPVIVFAILLCASLPSAAGGAAELQTTPQEPPQEAKRVLILYSFDKEESIYAGLDEALRSRLRAKLSNRVEFYTEYLDLVRFPERTHAETLVKLLRLKFAEKKPDVIIPLSYAALNFLLHSAKDLFPGIPIVALFNQRRAPDVEEALAKNPARQNFTGVEGRDDPASTVDLALRLQPDTQNVVVVVGSSPMEKFWLEQLKRDLSAYTARVKVTYLTDLPLREMAERMAALPPHSVILYTFFFEDAGGQFYLPEEALSLISAQANAPVYGIYLPFVGHGIVGGRVVDPQTTGLEVADRAARVLSGELANEIPSAADLSAQDAVDWRQLRRWGIAEKRVPAGTNVLYREPSAWERNREFIAIGVLLFLVQGYFIFVLLLERTRRRQAEKQLLREKTFSDALFESLPGVVFVQDENHRNVRWNREGARIARTHPSEVEPLGNLPERLKELARQKVQEVWDKGRAEVELELLAKDGKTIPYYVTASRLELDGKRYYVVAGTDISELKRAEEKLRQAEERFSKAFHSSPEGCAISTLREARFIEANDVFVRMSGYERSEVIGHTVAELKIWPYPEERAALVKRVMETGRVREQEARFRTKLGKIIEIRLSAEIIYLQNEPCLLGLARDVTEQNLLEEQFRQAQKMEAMGRLAAGVAHDFNNLLGAIIGYSELLGASMSPGSASLSRVEAIKLAGQRAAALTTQLLAYSRKHDLQPRVVNLNAVVLEAERLLRRLIGEDVELFVIHDPKIGYVKADPGQMAQVIMNLAVNARDAMPGGGKLTIQTANVAVDGGANLPIQPGQYVKLAVSDDGTGMDEQTKARVFEPFFTTKPAGQGTGLGLATVYGIVEQSGGAILVDSKIGVGTTFEIYLPRVEEVAPSLVIETRASDVDRASETILLVEDEVTLRALVAESLQDKGYRVLVAGNGVEALRLAEEHRGPIQLLITDVIMPAMSGPELVQAMVNLRPEICVLYISGYTADKLTQYRELDPEVPLLQKPFKLAELAQKVRDLLTQKAEGPSAPGRIEGTGAA